VNGAYGEYFRGKAMSTCLNGRGFPVHWIVSQEGSNFYPCWSWNHHMASKRRLSRIGPCKGKQLQLNQIQNTINDCLLSDALLSCSRGPLRQQQQLPTHSLKHPWAIAVLSCCTPTGPREAVFCRHLISGWALTAIICLGDLVGYGPQLQ